MGNRLTASNGYIKLTVYFFDEDGKEHRGNILSFSKKKMTTLILLENQTVVDLSFELYGIYVRPEPRVGRRFQVSKLPELGDAVGADDARLAYVGNA